MIKQVKKFEIFLKYISVSLLSFLVDILFFNVFLVVFKNNDYRIIISTILARIISSFFNFLMNKNKVFKSDVDNKIALIEYYSLVVIQMLVSALLVNKIYSLLTINENFIKIPVELFLFICNYFIQKKVIFKSKKETI